MRKIEKKVISESEDIVHTVHIYGELIRVNVARGTIDENGKFIKDEYENIESFEVRDEEYNEFMKANPATKKPAGQFRKNDLWDMVDAKRNKKKEKKD